MEIILRTSRHCCFILLLLMIIASPSALPYQSVEEANEIIQIAKAKGDTVHEQALELVTLAWPAPPGDPVVSALARRELVELGTHSTLALQIALRTIPPLYSADVVACLLENHDNSGGTGISFFEAALYDAVWYGSTEARRLAIAANASLGHKSSLLPMIDAAYEEPILVLAVVKALGDFASDRGRFYLKEVLESGTPEQRLSAAHAMTRIGNKSLELLRESVLSDDQQTRLTALDALLPISSTDDLSIFHEYASKYSSEDPLTWQRLSERVSMLEEIMETQLVH
jgi:hypothetical protein